MLKLKRASREGIISVIMRDKEYLFTRPFAIALTIAVAIHLTLLILFHVGPFKIGSNETVFTPTRVEADAATIESVVAEAKPAVHTLRGLPTVPNSIPILPHDPKFLMVRPVEYTKAESATNQAFSLIEQQIYQPEFDPLLRSQQKPLEIIISGVLGEHKLLGGLINQENQPLPKVSNPKTDSQRVIYSVMVQGQTGRIFWFEPAQLSYDTVVDKYTENIMRQMKFATDPKTIAINGTIEFHFNPEAK